MSGFRFGVLAAVACLGVSLSAPANAVTYELDIISAPGIGSGSQGSVILTQVNANQVDVDVVLADDVLLVNSGGPHTPFVFNLAPAKAGATVTITSVTTPSFFVQPGTQQATPYGDFTNAIGYDGQNGGGHGNAGPLEFSVFFAGGLSLSDFVANTGGYFFAADVLGTGGATGSVASDGPCLTCDPSDAPDPTPIPGAALLMGSVLAGGAGFGAWRRRREKTAA